MADQIPEGQTPKPESLQPKPAPEKPVEAPIGQAEQTIVNRIDQDGDEDKVLQDIAGSENSVNQSAAISNEVRARYPEVKAWSFTEARALQKGFSRDFILGSVNRNLMGPDGSRALFMKTYLDEVMPDAQEANTTKSPEELSRLHLEAVQMIADNLSVGTVNLTDEQKQFIKFQKDQYVDGLKKKSETWEGFIEQTAAGQNPEEFTRFAQLGGLGIKTNQGNVDISEFGGTKLPNIRSNIRIQTEISGQFVHWETDSVLRAKLSGKEVKMDRRIYLNPKTSDLVGTFSQLMTAFNEQGISVQGKMWDRACELASQIRAKEARPVRADAIVLTVKDSDADRVLAKVLEMYQKDPTIFADRPTPKIPLKIAPGIAIGDEPLEAGTSLTSHREKVLQEAASLTRQKLGLKEGDTTTGDDEKTIRTFSSVFSELAPARGVNPNNLAFNSST